MTTATTPQQIINLDQNTLNSINEYKKNQELKKNNSLIMYYIKRYIQEVFEAAMALIVLLLITKKNFTFNDMVRVSCIFGLVTLILEEYNQGYLSNMKQGFHFTIGASALMG